MGYFSFNPFGTESINLSFTCCDCNSDVVSEDIPIPSPDYCSDTASGSQTEEEGYAICETCDREFEITVFVTYAGGDGVIEGIDDVDLQVIENPEPYYEEQYDAVSNNTMFFETFKSEIDNLKELNKINLEPLSTDKTLRRQLYAGIIASMETYLSDAFINTTLNSEIFFKKYVETFKDFKNQSLTIDKFYELQQNLRKICKKSMLDVIYHNLGKVKGMCKDTLNVDLGDISIPSKAVAKRHHIVHRNGKDKEGNIIEITQTEISTLADQIEGFIKNVDEQIDNLE